MNVREVEPTVPLSDSVPLTAVTLYVPIKIPPEIEYNLVVLNAAVALIV